MGTKTEPCGGGGLISPISQWRRGSDIANIAVEAGV